MRGYEIHHGATLCAVEGACAASVSAPSAAGAVRPAVLDAAGAVLGWERTDVPVWGTYVHGVFDADAFRRRLLDDVRRLRGLPPVGGVTEFSMEPELERLADVVEQALDMPAIYRMLGL